ncbi:hypothetical protein TBC1_12655 [Lentimicrobium saccharophilum]|uniref:DUF4435 domain-containing protein n=1 Tax=Lentimicrobium saccharophilum TaxID=1678841 RepID=A0A0S7C1H8_9BACT|nr:DUF4435 domain-containing protein [Lentimicrobium saccharophilum]GAP44843.1 hypothetical protein TBC1_12655 [Lentimicrobium saccharophilum]
MSTDYKRKIEEVITLYKLEPEICDLWVEGPSDSYFYGHFMSRMGSKICIIKGLETLDCSTYFEAYPTLNSNREKGIFFSNLLNQQIKNDLRVRIIVDKDLESLVNRDPPSKFTLYTDFSSIEMYLFNEVVFSKIFEIGLNGFPIRPSETIRAFENILVDFFVFRCARFLLDNSAILVSLETNVVIEKHGLIKFDFNDYLSKFLNRNNLLFKREIYLEKINELKKNINQDLRNYMHGHDFVNLFFKYVNRIKNNDNFKIDNFSKALFLAVELAELRKYNLFNNLEKVYKN